MDALIAPLVRAALYSHPTGHKETGYGVQHTDCSGPGFGSAILILARDLQTTEQPPAGERAVRANFEKITPA